MDSAIPVIRFEPFLAGTPADRHGVALAITRAFQTSGFLYLKDHGIPPSVVSRVFAASARFFARPQAHKDALGWTTPESNRGYVSYGREKVTVPDDAASSAPELVESLRASNPDLKETMEIGRDGVPGAPNRWPDQLDEDGERFTQTMRAFFDTCKALHLQIMRAIALGLNLPEHFFDEFVDAGDNNLRLLHYPPVPKQVFRRSTSSTSSSRRVRTGEHSDYGSITLLFQDSHGGLQARKPNASGGGGAAAVDDDSAFVDVIPIADSIVVNAGDLLARWSNDTIKSTRHRVIEPPSLDGDGDGDGDGAASGMYPARYSIAYFCNPNIDKVIDVLPGTYGGDRPAKKYAAIRAGDYLVQRLGATI